MGSSEQVWACPTPGTKRRVRRRTGIFRHGSRCHHRSTAMLDVPFLPFCAFLGTLGLLCVAMVGTWCQHWRGGFSLDGSSRTFNWHPVLMVMGLVVLYGAAALVYRIPHTWSGPKLPWKVLHGSLALGAFILTVLGLAAVFRFHNAQGTPNMYSLHSWMGLGTVLLFSCQWAAGFGAFLLPWAPAWLRALYKPIHIFFGSTILMLSVASCVSGINEKLFFSLKNGTMQYKLLPAEAVFANTLGLLILIFGVLVVAALARPSWKRPDSDSPDSRQPLLSAER
ncbi:PREDICTED: cytochrome b ascorbate-dependent protein 3 isoform X1 [Ficedula albicollis]|uniref:cytochrome b ascorbate-dependent protein 3 isoform X1 n=1 Tax=Ficedula albicollis TaxID=59894 RepID=UPI0007AD7F96|nr:PREDICTED: cytochrome b ascorbate-dependent protein 3 isoform X1 [Ficedula albicollis]